MSLLQPGLAAVLAAAARLMLVEATSAASLAGLPDIEGK